MATRPSASSVRTSSQNGDLLRFGDYQVSVVMEAEGRKPPRRNSRRPRTDRCASDQHRHALRTIGRAAQTDIGAALDLDSLRGPRQPAARRVDSGQQSGGFRPVNAYGQAVARVPRPVETTPPVEPEPEPDEEMIARRIARLAKAVGRSDPRNGCERAGALRRAEWPAGFLPWRWHRRRRLPRTRRPA